MSGSKESRDKHCLEKTGDKHHPDASEDKLRKDTNTTRTSQDINIAWAGLKPNMDTSEKNIAQA